MGVLKRGLSFVMVVLLFTTLFTPNFAKADASEWKKVSPNPTAGSMASVAYGNGQFVAVGDRMGIVVSKDGKQWSEVSYPQHLNSILYSVSYGNGRFVAIGSGIVLTLEDGETEWKVESPFGNGMISPYIESLVYANGKFVGIGSRKVVTSTDGVTWNQQASPGLDYSRSSVTYGKNMFVAVGNGSNVMQSVDGESWNLVSLNSTYTFNGITYGDDKYVAVGKDGLIMTSTDGTNWNSVISNTSNTLNNVTYDNVNHIYVAVGNWGTLLTSMDGTNWTVQETGTQKELKGVVSHNGLTVVVGYTGLILTSNNGVLWTHNLKVTGANLWGIAYGNGMYVAVGSEDWTREKRQAVILTSTDGENWINRKQTLIPFRIDALGSINYYKGKFIAIGSRQENSGIKGLIMTSSDGVSWDEQIIDGSPVDVGISNQQYTILMMDGKILTSSDGQSWGTGSTGSNYMQFSFAYGDGIYVVTAGGVILTSSDGITWSKHTIVTSNNSSGVSKLTYGNGLFVGVGSAGEIFTSEDGQTWTKRDSTVTTPLYNVQFDGSVFMAVGEAGVFLTSTDGINWSKHQSIINTRLTAITSNGNEIIAVGLGGVILRTSLRPPSVTVNYLPGDHGTLSGISEQVEVGGHPVAVPTVTPINGYHFAGWSSDGGVTKLTSHQVATSTVTADVTYTAYYTQLVLGDADGDGKVTASDALLLTKYIKGKITLTPQQLQALDMNGDGKWDEEDIKIILAISVGKG